MVYKVDTLREHFDPSYTPEITTGRKPRKGEREMNTPTPTQAFPTAPPPPPTNVAPSAGGNLAHSATNDPDVLRKQKWDKLIADTKDFGALAGKGEEVQVRYLLIIVQNAFEGVIDNTQNKHGNSIDDAGMLAEQYWNARNKEVVFNPKAPNQRKTISNMRACVTLGGWSKGGPGEPIQMVNQAMTLYKNLRKDPANAKRMIDGANYLIAIARRMKKSDQVLDLEELRELSFKKVNELATVEDRLAAMRKELTKMRDGTHTVGACASSNIEVAIKALNKELKGIADAKRSVEQAEVQEQAGAEIAQEADNQAQAAKAPKVPKKAKEEKTAGDAAPASTAASPA